MWSQKNLHILVLLYLIYTISYIDNGKKEKLFK